MRFYSDSLPAAADLYGDIEPAPKVRYRDYAPGLLVALLASLASAYLAVHYHAPLTLMALLVGLALNFLSGDKRLLPGLDAWGAGQRMRGHDPASRSRVPVLARGMHTRRLIRQPSGVRTSASWYSPRKSQNWSGRARSMRSTPDERWKART